MGISTVAMGGAQLALLAAGPGRSAAFRASPVGRFSGSQTDPRTRATAQATREGVLRRSTDIRTGQQIDPRRGSATGLGRPSAAAIGAGGDFFQRQSDLSREFTSADVAAANTNRSNLDSLLGRPRSTQRTLTGRGTGSARNFTSLLRQF
jgi:hypothetical protein